MEDNRVLPRARDTSEVRNHIVRALRPAAQDFLVRRVLTRETHAGEVICEDGAPFTHAVFPHEGVVSLMANMENGKSVEKTSIGLEGFLGFSVIMGGGDSFGRAVVQVPGYASWLALTDLDEALAEFVCVREAMLRYAKSLITQVMESVACNSMHSAEQRISRWLLHARDRVPGDHFMLKQQAIAEALGLRRATVSEICSRLQHEGILDYSRGAIAVLDRAGLEHRACECYGRVRRASFS